MKFKIEVTVDMSSSEGGAGTVFVEVTEEEILQLAAKKTAADWRFALYNRSSPRALKITFE